MAFRFRLSGQEEHVSSCYFVVSLMKVADGGLKHLKVPYDNPSKCPIGERRTQLMERLRTRCEKFAFVRETICTNIVSVASSLHQYTVVMNGMLPVTQGDMADEKLCKLIEDFDKKRNRLLPFGCTLIVCNTLWGLSKSIGESTESVSIELVDSENIPLKTQWFAKNLEKTGQTVLMCKAMRTIGYGIHLPFAPIAGKTSKASC